MKQYIDKSALVAEIKELMRANELYLSKPETDEIKFQKTGAYSVLNDLLHSIDTLEVKEAVDAEIVEVEDNNYSIYAYTHLEICTDEDLSKICKAGDKAIVIIK